MFPSVIVTRPNGSSNVSGHGRKATRVAQRKLIFVIILLTNVTFIDSLSNLYDDGVAAEGKGEAATYRKVIERRAQPLATSNYNFCPPGKHSLHSWRRGVVVSGVRR